MLYDKKMANLKDKILEQSIQVGKLGKKLGSKKEGVVEPRLSKVTKKYGEKIGKKK